MWKATEGAGYSDSSTLSGGGGGCFGLSNRTIGNIYCITISAVQHRKLKLKKDVFGESNPDITLEQILNSK